MTEQLVQLQAVLTRRFLFNALLPVLTIGTASLVVLLAFLDITARITGWWEQAEVFSQFLAIAGYIAAIWFISVAVAGQWRGIVRLFEGYPIIALYQKLGRTAPGVLWHQAKLLEVRNRRPNVERAYYSYPRERWLAAVLPTRLGNVLLAAERYPVERYGIDPVVFWPRLYPLLPEQFQRDYEEFVREYEFPLVVAFLLAAAGVSCGAVALLTGQEPVTFTIAFVGFLGAAYSAYCISLPSAVQMAEQQRTAFDLYRGRLLEAWPPVQDVEDEKVAFGLIRSFIVSDAPARWSVPQDAYLARLRRSSRRDGEN